MADTLQFEFHHVFITPPGDTLLEVLEDREMSHAELAKRMGYPVKAINLAGHILLHEEDRTFLEIYQEDRDEAEMQADRFTANFLTDKVQRQRFSA